MLQNPFVLLDSFYREKVPYTNMLDGKGRRHGQHITGFNTKTKRKEGVITINYNKISGQTKMQ
jgi:hypothetical protein